MLSEFPKVVTGQSIYEFIRARLDPAGRLENPDMALPDEPADDGGLRWAAGAMDGALGHHFGGGSSGEEKAARVVEHFLQACEQPSEANLGRLYEEVSADNVLDFIDPVVQGLTERRPDPAALQALGRWLGTTAPDRGGAKVGLAILGLTGVGGDIEVVRVLGAHEEFTLFAAVALLNGLAEPESELWALACAVHGWGRIHCVERLRKTRDPAIRSWILREGFRNSVMNEYLAYIAATTGGLLDALRRQDVDRELLTAAGEILVALIGGGPAEDIDDYESGADAVAAYLEQMSTRAETLGDYHALAVIRDFLSKDEGWEEQSTRGWTASRRDAFEARCDEILGREEWHDRVTVGLLSDDRSEFWYAEQAARTLGLDTFDVHVQKIREAPLEPHWFEAWRQADGERAEVLLVLARELLPLEEIATGPANEVGLGPKWAPHIALDWTLQALRGHVGRGGDLVLAGLCSPVTRNRRMALNVLLHWPGSAWPDGARELLESLAGSDPDEHGRTHAVELLRRQASSGDGDGGGGDGGGGDGGDGGGGDDDDGDGR